MRNILVCFDTPNGSDCLTTTINGTMEEIKEYYIGKYFDGKIAEFVLDIERPFKMKVEGVNDEFRLFKFNRISFDNPCMSFAIELENLETGDTFEVEPKWFYCHDKRIIKQGSSDFNIICSWDLCKFNDSVCKHPNKNLKDITVKNDNMISCKMYSSRR